MDLSRYINIRWIKPPVFSLCLVPLADLAWTAFHDGLGPKRWQMLHRLVYVSACCGRDSLLLAREIRRYGASSLRSGRRHSTLLPLSCRSQGTYPSNARTR